MSGPTDETNSQAICDLITEIAGKLGESDVGSQNLPRYTKQALDKQRDNFTKDMAAKLEERMSALCVDDQIRLLHAIWSHSLDVWTKSLAYRTIEAVAYAVGRATEMQTNELDARYAVGRALHLMRLDGRVFARMNLSDAAELECIVREEAIPGAGTIAADLCKAARLKNQSSDISTIVSGILEYANQIHIFYCAIAETAGALAEFERWLATARPAGHRTGPALWPLDMKTAPRARIEEALEYLAKAKTDLVDQTLSEIEPWEDLLSQVRGLMAVHPGGCTPDVLIPRQVWVRYCFPFAVHDDSGKCADKLLKVMPDTRPHPLITQLRQELRELEPCNFELGEPAELAGTQFFRANSGKDGHFGGIRINLPDLHFIGITSECDPRLYRAWLDMNRMGNFCLCVETATPLTNIPPARLYQTLRAGTPFAHGEPVSLAVGQGTQWDNLYMFAQGMIKAVADAYYVEPAANDTSAEPSHYLPGNPHQVLVVQTDIPIATRAEKITSRLDNAVGGRILLRPLQRAAATLDEWIRFAPQQHAGESAVVAVPELGSVGDWFVHTGETTVFGVVAAPSWVRDVYPEVAQFASSWVPMLQLWNQYLKDAIKEHDTADRRSPTPASVSYELRCIERQVRRHLAEMSAEDLCATSAYRRFLDTLLETVGIARLHRELEIQLKAAEQLADYFDRRSTDETVRRRDTILFLIALLQVFGLSGFVSLFNGGSYWRGVLVALVFVLVLIVGVCLWLWSGGRRRAATSKGRSHESSGHDREAGPSRRTRRREFLPDRVAEQLQRRRT